MINKRSLYYLLCAVVVSVCAEPATARTSSPRTLPLHYRPVDDASVECINGTKLYNRALYGARTGFRLECSDIPTFGIYLPRMGGNLSLTLPEGDCTALYTPGKMTYNQGGVQVVAQVLRSDDAALWQIKNLTTEPLEIAVRFGGVADKGFSRNGDLGVDPSDCFALKAAYCTGNIYTINKDKISIEYGNKTRQTISLVIPASEYQLDSLPTYNGIIRLQPSDTKYIALTPADSKLKAAEMDIASVFNQAETERRQLASTLTISTPDPWINPIGNALAVAADGIWSGEAWLHGSIGWRTPHLGWRGAYIGDALGWFDRSQVHFSTYANNQVTDVPPVIGHPTQDASQAMARAEKKWGTQMYSNGYICRRPGKKDEMSHYDMNLVYADALCRHLVAVGDTAAMRKFYPVIKLHLDWEKRNFDPDDDGLYDGYCCIWASDALYYGGGATTHSSAYNMFAHDLASKIAMKLGETEDAQAWALEARKAEKALRNQLWLADKGVWGEFSDYYNPSRVHDFPGIWTIYHAVDSRIGTNAMDYAATRYIDREIPHLTFYVDGDTTLYQTISTTSWLPYSWSINNVAIGEIMHTALAYWQADRPDDAYNLMKSAVMDNMYTGASPLNFGQISQFDAARGECYRDFADPIGVWGRALTEGLFGINPDALQQKVTIKPGFPSDWDNASISLPQIQYSFARKGNLQTYEVNTNYPTSQSPILIVPVNGGVKSVKCNGKSIDYANYDEGLSINRPRIIITAPNNATSATIEIETEGNLEGKSNGKILTEGPITFTAMVDNGLQWWETSEKPLPSITERYNIPDNLDNIDLNRCQKLDLASAYNSKVEDIFNNEYVSPRPKVTTLQIPINGLGDWCHPLNTADIRVGDANGKNNIAFTSLWNNFPDSLEISLNTEAKNIYAIVAGSTNHMQVLMPNAEISLIYEDGSTLSTPLVPPLNYAPIEQDYYIDGQAFDIPDGRKPPMRVHLPTGQISRNLGYELALKGVDGRRIPGGAGVLLQLRHDSKKKVKTAQLKALAPDVVVGIMDIMIEN